MSKFSQRGKRTSSREVAQRLKKLQVVLREELAAGGGKLQGRWTRNIRLLRLKVIWAFFRALFPEEAGPKKRPKRMAGRTLKCNVRKRTPKVSRGKATEAPEAKVVTESTRRKVVADLRLPESMPSWPRG